MFVVMKLIKRTEAKIENIVTMLFEDEETGLVGMLPVFGTLEQAEKEYPGVPKFEVREVN